MSSTGSLWLWSRWSRVRVPSLTPRRAILDRRVPVRPPTDRTVGKRNTHASFRLVESGAQGERGAPQSTRPQAFEEVI